MKKLPYILAALLFAGLTNAQAQTTPKAAPAQSATKSMAQDGCMMMDGKMKSMDMKKSGKMKDGKMKGGKMDNMKM